MLYIGRNYSRCKKILRNTSMQLTSTHSQNTEGVWCSYEWGIATLDHIDKQGRVTLWVTVAVLWTCFRTLRICCRWAPVWVLMLHLCPLAGSCNGGTLTLQGGVPMNNADGAVLLCLAHTAIIWQYPSLWWAPLCALCEQHMHCNLNTGAKKMHKHDVYCNCMQVVLEGSFSMRKSFTSVW